MAVLYSQRAIEGFRPCSQLDRLNVGRGIDPAHLQPFPTIVPPTIHYIQPTSSAIFVIGRWNILSAKWLAFQA